MSHQQTKTAIAEARRELARLKQDLDALYMNYQAALHDVPINFQGEIHKYLCIRLSGFLEQIFFIGIAAYVRDASSDKAGLFALHGWKHAPNLNPEALDRLIGRFGDDWLNSLNALLDDTKRSQLGTLLKIRNDTAHGSNYSGSLPSVSSYKALVDDIFNWLIREIVQVSPPQKGV